MSVHDQDSLNTPEKIGLFVEGAAGGALCGAIGAFILYKFGVSFEAPVESTLIVSPAITGGFFKARSR